MPVAGYEVEEVDLDAIFDAMDPALVNTCYFYKCISICIDMGRIIGRSTVYYERLAKRVRERFNEEFLDKESMNYGTGDFCSNVYPLAFEMVPDAKTAAVAASLDNYIKNNDYSMMVGIFGASLIFGVLARFGYYRTIKAMLDRRQYPSFGYMMDSGASTIWETWDGKASGNHPMFGSVVSYFIKNLAGLRYYSRDGLFLLEPEFLDGVQSVSGSIGTVFGTAGVEWKIIPEQEKIKIGIYLPGNTKGALKINGETVIVENGITELTFDYKKTGKL